MNKTGLLISVLDMNQLIIQTITSLDKFVGKENYDSIH